MIFQGSFCSLTFRGGPTVPLPPTAPPGCGEGLAFLSPAAGGLHSAGTPYFAPSFRCRSFYQVQGWKSCNLEAMRVWRRQCNRVPGFDLHYHQ